MLRRVWWSDALAGWGFISPTVVLIGLFGLVPLVWAFVLSFEQNDLISPGKWVGLHNYRKLLHDPQFSNSVRNTVIYTIVFVPVCVFGSLLVAAALNRRIHGITFYRVAVFIPVVTSTVATGHHVQLAARPRLRARQRGAPQGRHREPGLLPRSAQALMSIVAHDGLGMARLRRDHLSRRAAGVPADLLEAAAIDGCSRWRAFWRVEVPLLAPTTLFLVIWLTINSLQLFDEIFVTTKGGPVGSTTVVVYYLYQQAFQFFNGGYASAIAFVLFVAILVITVDPAHDRPRGSRTGSADR